MAASRFFEKLEKEKQTSRFFDQLEQEHEQEAAQRGPGYSVLGVPDRETYTQLQEDGLLPTQQKTSSGTTATYTAKSPNLVDMQTQLFRMNELTGKVEQSVAQSRSDTTGLAPEDLADPLQRLAYQSEKEQRDQKTQELLTGVPKEAEEWWAQRQEEKNRQADAWETQQQSDFSRMPGEDKELLGQLWQATENVKRGYGLEQKNQLEQQLKGKGYDLDDLLLYYTMQKNKGKAAQEEAETRSQANQHGVWQSVKSVPAMWVGGAEASLDLIGQSLERAISGRAAPLDVNTEGQSLLRFAENTRDQVSGNIQQWADAKYGTNSWQGQVLSFAYQTGMSGADSVASMVAGPGASWLLASSAGASTARSALEQGASTEQAMLNGIMAGAMEKFFEEVSLGNLRAFKETQVNDAKDFFKNLFKTTFVNASEETATQFGNDMAEYLLMADKSQMRQVYNAAYDQAIDQGKDQRQAEYEANMATAAWLGQDLLVAGAGGAMMGLGFGVGGNALAWRNARQAQSPRANYARVVEENTRAEQGQAQNQAAGALAPAVGNSAQPAPAATDPTQPAPAAQAVDGTAGLGRQNGSEEGAGKAPDWDLAGKAVEKAAAGGKLTSSELKMFAPDGKHEENRARMAKALGLESLPETGSGTRSAILQADANRGQANETQAQPLAMQPEVPTQAADTAQAAQGTGVTQTEAAPQNGEPLVGSPQWLAQNKAEEQTRAAIAKEKNKVFSIQTDQQGEYVRVDTDQDLFEGKDPKEWAKIARQYIQAKFQGTVLPVGRESSAYVSGDAKAEYAHPANRRMDQNARNAKMRAATELDNLLRTAKEPTQVPDDGRHPEATGGWTHYTVRFQVGDKMFTGVVDIMNTSNGRRFYDITKIKELPLSTEPSFEARTAVLGEPGEPARESGLASASETAASGRPSYDSTVAESGENVNGEADAPDMSWADSYQADREETDQYGRQRVSAKTREQVRKIGAKFRRNVRFEELGPGENGYFDRSTGEIVLSTYLKPGKGAVSVLVHELTHSAELARTYGQLRDFVKESEVAAEWLREKGFDSLEQYENFLRNEYRRQGKDADPEAEAVASFAEEKLFQDEKSLKELESGHRGILQKLLDLVRTALGQLTGRTSEENELRRVERMLEKALKETEGQMGQSQAEGSESRQYSITLGMSEEQRARELKDARITMPLVNNEQFNRVSAELEQERIEKNAAVYAKILGDKFEIFRGFENPGMEIEFEFSKSSAKESANKQIHRGGSSGLQQLHKLFSCFEKVIRGAVPVEIHSDRYKGTRREDPTLKQTYVLLGAYRDGNPDTGELDTVPVIFQIKEFIPGTQVNKLYVTVTAKKTETEGHNAGLPRKKFLGTSSATSVSANSTIAEKARGVKEKQVYCMVEKLVQSLNAEDGWVLKYFPDSWLSEAQKQGKQAALEEDAKKVRELEEETRQRQKKQEEEKQARENGSGASGQKTRQFALDLSEDIRRRKEERDQKTRQAVEEMDRAVRAGLQKDAARREELGRKVARDMGLTARQDETTRRMADQMKKLVQENNRLKKQVGRLKEEFRITKGHRMSADHVAGVAGRLLKRYESRYDRARLTDQLATLFESIANDPEMNWDTAMSEAAAIGRQLLEESRDTRPSLRQEDARFEALYKAMGATITLRPEEYRSITAAFGKPSGGRVLGLRVKLGDSSTRSLDEYNHSELSELWPEFFDSETQMSAEDIFERMAEARRAVNEPAVENGYGMDQDEAALDIAQEIFEEYMNTPETRTFADKQAQKLAQLRAEYAKSRAEAKREKRQAYRAGLEEARKARDEQIERLKEKQRQARKAHDEKLAAEYERRVQRLKKAQSDWMLNRLSEFDRKMEAQRQRMQKKVERAEAEAQRQRQIKEKAWDASAKSRLKAGIEKKTRWFTAVATHPDKAHHVPRDLMELTAKVAEVANTMLADPNPEKNTQYLTDLLGRISRVQDSPDYAVSQEWKNSGVYQMVSQLLEDLKNVGEYKTTGEMDRYQLEQVDKILGAIRHNLTEANRLIGREESIQVSEAAARATRQVRQSRGIDQRSRAGRAQVELTELFMTPRTFFNMIGGWTGGELDRMRRQLSEGTRKMYRIQMEAARHFAPVTGEKNQARMEAFSGRDAKLVDIGLKDEETGRPVKITHAQLCSIWMHLQNEQNRNHMARGGFSVPDPVEYARGNMKEAFARSRRVIVDHLEIQAKVAAAMDDYDRQWVKLAKPFFDEFCRRNINETSLALVGYTKADVDNYYPISTDKNFSEREFSEVVRDGSLEGMGMLKSRIARASNPINLEGIDQVVARQSESVAKYAGLAIPVRDFSKLWNTAEPGWQDSLHNAVAHKWGASGVKYLDNLMADIQMGRDRDSTIITRFLGRLRRNYAQSVLTLNPNSAVSQVSGYPTAASVLGWKAVNRGWKDMAGVTLPGGRKKLDKINEEMAQHSPMGWIRQKGSTQELYDLKNNPNWAVRMATRSRGAKAMKLDKLAKPLLGWLDRMDENTVAGIWQASKYAAQEKMGLETAGSQAPAAAGQGITEQMRRALSSVMEMESVATVPLGEERVPYKNDRKEDAKTAAELFKSLGRKAVRPGFGTVMLTREGAKHSIFQGNSAAKQAAFSAVKEVIEKGKEIARDANHKGRNFDTYTFAAPVVFGDQKAAVAVVVKESIEQRANKSYYIHEIYDSEGGFIRLDEEGNILSENKKRAAASATLEPGSSADTAAGERIRSFTKAASADLLPTASADAAGERIRSFTDIVAQVFGKGKEQPQASLKFDSKEQENAYWDKVTELFERAISETQPNYTVMEQSAISRSPNEVNKMFTMFKTPTIANFNVLYDALGNYQAKKNSKSEVERRTAKKQLAQAISAQVVQAAMWAALSVMAKGIIFHKWDDDRDETGEVTWWDTLTNILDNTLSSLADATFPVAGETVYELVSTALQGETFYGGLRDQGIELLGDLENNLSVLLRGGLYLVSRASSGEELEGKDIEDALVNVCTAAGIPAIEARSWYKSIRAWGEDISTRDWLQAGYTTTTANAAAAAGKAMQERSYDLKDAQKVVDRWYSGWKEKNPDKEPGDAISSLKGVLKKKYKEEYLAADQQTREKMAGVLTGITIEGEPVLPAQPMEGSSAESLADWVFDADAEAAQPEIGAAVADSYMDLPAFERMTEAQQAKAEEYAQKVTGYLVDVQIGKKDWDEDAPAKWMRDIYEDAGKNPDKAAKAYGEAILAKAICAGVEGEKDRNGKTVPGSVKEARIRALVGAGYSRSKAEEMVEKYM